VFQSTSFDLKAASKIIGTQNKNLLQGLYNCHLLEVEEHPRRSKDPEKPDITYSLHPLVYRFISEWKKPEDLKSAYQSFVSYYERFINTVVKLLESKYWKGQQKLEKHKVHILKFYEIMSEHPQLLKSHPKKTDDNGVLSKKRISDLADILLCLVQNRRMFQVCK
jgi:superfamily I DNA/RNA helicase